MRSKGTAGLALGAVGALLVFLYAPLIPFSTSVSIPKNYASDAGTACEITPYNASQYQACLNRHLVPPTVVTGRGSAAFSLLRIGPSPYGSVSLVIQGNKSALVYWGGQKWSMAEVLDFSWPPHEGWPPILLPPGTVQLSQVRFWPASNGLLTFSATASGIPRGNYSGGGFINYVPGPRVYFDYPGYGSNLTDGDFVWHTPLAYIPCGGSGGSCVASREVAAMPGLRAGATYPMRIVIVGYEIIGVENRTETFSNGQTYAYAFPKLEPYVYEHDIEVVYPGSGVNAAWVQAFIDAVNGARTKPLAEEAGLDSFAQTRFNTAATNFQISDYGFDGQSAKYFGPGVASTEEILYPSTYSPSEFAQVLKSEAPAHWSGLIDGTYTHFGYYVGNAPSVEFNLSCPVNEIVQRNVNITQIAIQNGCQFKMETVTWLLIVLSS